MAGLIDIVDAYHAGQDRRRKQDTDVADRRQKADEWSATQGKGLKKATYDQYGNPNGLETNQENRQRDVDRFDTEEATAPATPLADPIIQQAKQQAQQASTPEGTAARNADRDRLMGQPQAGKAETSPGAPSPLVRDPKAALAEQTHDHTMAQKAADAIVPPPEMNPQAAPPVSKPQAPITGPGGEKVIMPEGATGMTYDKNDPKVTQNGNSFVPARSTDIPASGDVAQNPSPEASALAAMPSGGQPAPKPRSELSDYALGRTVDMHTMLPKNGIGFVDASGLPPEVQAMLGASNGKVRSDVLQTYMKGQFGNEKAHIMADGKKVDPLASELIDAIQDGNLTVGGAVSTYTRINKGQGPTPATQAEFNKAFERSNKDRNFGLSQDKFADKQGNDVARITSDAAKQAAKGAEKDLEALGAVRSGLTMLNKKDTNGLRKLIPILAERGFIPQRLTNQMVGSDPGRSDWDSRVDQFVTGIEDGTITPGNIKFFKDQFTIAANEHLKNVQLRSSQYYRQGMGALKNKGMSDAEAKQAMDEVMDPDYLSSLRDSVTEVNKPEQGKAPAPVATSGNSEQAKYDHALAVLNARTDISPEKKAANKAAMDVRFKSKAGK